MSEGRRMAWSLRSSCLENDMQSALNEQQLVYSSTAPKLEPLERSESMNEPQEKPPRSPRNGTVELNRSRGQNGTIASTTRNRIGALSPRRGAISTVTISRNLELLGQA